MELWQSWGKKVKILPDVRFNVKSGEHQLALAFQVQNIQGLGDFTGEHIQAAGALLDYLNLTQKGQMPRLERPKIIISSEFVQMDAATFRSLELLQTQQGQRKGSFFHCLNKTVTAPGARLLATRISFPFREKKSIDTRLDVVSYMYSQFSLTEQLRDYLKKTVDIQRILSRASLGRAGPRDLSGLKETFQQLQNMVQVLKKIHEEIPPPALQRSLTKALEGFDSLCVLLSKALKEDAPLLMRDGEFIQPGYSQELDHFKTLKSTAHSKIKELQQQYSRETGINNLKIKHNNMLGYYVEITSLNAQKLQEFEIFVHRQTLANNMRFTTQILVELSQDLIQAKDKALEIELEIFSELVKAILQYAEPLIITARALAELDLLTSFASLARERSYVRSAVEESSVFQIEQGRHPVVELSQQEGGTFVPNDCNLTSQENIWIITGPNMAGKSTFLRQNALIILMAQIGSFVPAAKSCIGLIDRIFSRVGASDDLARGQSTFMVEMIETALILNQATEKSFVILDEVGRGTATYDGISIAWACLEYLHAQNKCRCLFATHYHELTALEKQLPRLASYTVKVQEWQEKIVFLHQIIKGTAGRSYGVHVAELAGVPDSVIKRAQFLLANFEKEDKGKVSWQAKEPQPLFETNKIPSIEQKKALSFYENLKKLDVNNLTPKQALDWLYKLKQ